MLSKRTAANSSSLLLSKQILKHQRKTIFFSCSSPEEQKKLYEHHIPTTYRQRLLLGVASSFAALFDPERGEMVATAGETLPLTLPAVNAMRLRMKQSETGQQILRDRPRVNEMLNKDVSYEALSKYPEDTLGYHYYAYMKDHGFKASERTPVRFIEKNEELAYVMQRYREVHDFVHALSGMQPSVLEEIAVKWYEFVQTGLPMTMLSSIVAPIRLPSEEKKILFTTLVPWAVRNGLRSEFYMNVYFEKLLDVNIDKVREMLKFEKAPSVQLPNKI